MYKASDIIREEAVTDSKCSETNRIYQQAYCFNMDLALQQKKQEKFKNVFYSCPPI
jgi:hypothetical protein